MSSEPLRWTVAATDAGSRLDAWLAKRPEVGSRSRARDWIARGKVFLNSNEVTFDRGGTPVQGGDEVAVWVDRPGSSRPRPRDVITHRDALRIIFEDAFLLVADKPSGLLVEPLPHDRSEVTLRDLVADHVGASRGARAGGGAGGAKGAGGAGGAAFRRVPAPPPALAPPAPPIPPQALVVHRIDRDTSGLVLFAKSQHAQAALKRQFERHTAERTYLAVLEGRVTPLEGVWRDRLVWDKVRLRQRRARNEDEQAARDAEASYTVVEQFEQAALVEIRLVTGKRNQIRIQAALRHHPLVGERIYRRADAHAPVPALERQALHAARLAFRHPHTGSRVQFEASLPDDLRRLLVTLRGHRAKRD